jgi:hypothetical protein
MPIAGIDCIRLKYAQPMMNGPPLPLTPLRSNAIRELARKLFEIFESKAVTGKILKVKPLRTTKKLSSWLHLVFSASILSVAFLMGEMGQAL